MDHLANKKSYYEILEVPTNASQSMIQQGHITAKNAYSMDSLALYSLLSKEECAAMLSQIDEAYSILGDPDKRRKYDQARGFNTEQMTQSVNSIYKNEPQRIREAVISPTFTTDKSLTKIVANQKFALQYTPDPEMEKTIETTTSFTGEFLRKIREYKNVDFLRLADMTKVSKSYLMAIEDERLDLLPAAVYVRGFVYQYAKCVKLNPDAVATSYMARIKDLKEGKI